MPKLGKTRNLELRDGVEDIDGGDDAVGIMK